MPIGSHGRLHENLLVDGTFENSEFLVTLEEYARFGQTLVPNIEHFVANNQTESAIAPFDEPGIGLNWLLGRGASLAIDIVDGQSRCHCILVSALELLGCHQNRIDGLLLGASGASGARINLPTVSCSFGKSPADNVIHGADVDLFFGTITVIILLDRDLTLDLVGLRIESS